ncbi:MAG TPA: Npun_F0494 family protein [Coleofasciculaceae cyanobacterium]
MTSTAPDHSTAALSKLTQYSPATVKRAERALRCAPFELKLLTAMRQQSVELKAIAGKAGWQTGYTHRPLSELAAENYLLWLIQVGLLRREVDGQGLTDSFRLTPLGHQLSERWQQRGRLAAPSLSDRLYNALSRRLRLPSWIQF